MVYTICIGSNEKRVDNMKLARQKLSALFPGIRFSKEVDTVPLFFHRPTMFSNQVARFSSTLDADRIVALLKSIESEAGRMEEDKKREIVRLDIDLLMCDAVVYKPDDLLRDYVIRGIQELDLND